MLVIIILYLLRQGNYFLNGFPLFMWMYYYVRKQKEQRIFNLQNGITTEEAGEEGDEQEPEKKQLTIIENGLEDGEEPEKAKYDDDEEETKNDELTQSPE
jgi:hypothetical protein